MTDAFGTTKNFNSMVAQPIAENTCIHIGTIELAERRHTMFEHRPGSEIPTVEKNVIDSALPASLRPHHPQASQGGSDGVAVCARDVLHPH